MTETSMKELKNIQELFKEDDINYTLEELKKMDREGLLCGEN